MAPPQDEVRGRVKDAVDGGAKDGEREGRDGGVELEDGEDADQGEARESMSESGREKQQEKQRASESSAAASETTHQLAASEP